MSDGVDITPGSGATVATDDAGASGHVQLVKLAISTDGSAALIPADSDGLSVNVTNASFPVTGTFWQATQPVSGTFWQATQPVSLASVPSHDVTNAGTFAVQVAQSGTWNVTNVSGTVSLPTGASTAAKQPALGTAGSASADVISVQGIASMTALKVDGSDVTQPVSVATLPALAAGTNNIGDVDVLTVPADPFGANADAGSATGSISAKLRFIASTGIPVTGSVAVTGTFWQATQPVSLASVPSHAVTNAGTFAVQAVGNVAHSDTDSGAPVKVGMRAVAHGANPTAVDAAERVDWLANRAGIPWVIGGHPNVVTVKHTTITTAVTDAAIITVSAGTKIVVTRITATLDNASTVFPTMVIGFGTANTPTTTGVIVSHGGVPAGGGVNVGDGSGILGIGADNEDLRVTTTGNATGNGLQICVSYYLIES